MLLLCKPSFLLHLYIAMLSIKVASAWSNLRPRGAGICRRSHRLLSTSVSEALEEGLGHLAAVDDEAESSVVHLMAHVLDLDWNTGYRDLQQVLRSNSSLGQRRLTDPELVQWNELIQRRQQHEPLQYLVGQWDFFQHVFTIRPPLLCPRPETEELVELVMREELSCRRVLDVGCGTGCIGISLAAAKGCSVVALDVDPVAVQVSRENADRILEDPSLYEVLLMSAADYATSEPFDVVVSNPPYIPEADMASLDETVAGYESEGALCGGVDGLDVVRTIVAQLPAWTKSGAVCWMEVDPTHPAMIRDWLGAAPDPEVEFVESRKDMFGRDRFVKLRVL